MRDAPQQPASSGRQRMLDLARAVTPPRFLRQYRQRAAFRERVRRLLVWSIVPIVGWAFVFADGGLASIASRRIRIHRLQQQVVELERRQAMLEHSIERRESDPQVLERMARERYGMARHGETVYRIVEISADDARRIDRAQRALERERDKRDRAQRGAADPDGAGHARR
jgi:cell division protein FtsB